MSRHIQAYFRSEDEAEGARTSLITFDTESLEVGQLHDRVSAGNNVLVPIIPLGGSGTLDGGGTSGSNVNGMTTTGGVIGVEGTRGNISTDSRNDGGLVDTFEVTGDGIYTNEDYNNLEYVMSLKVQDRDYEEIVQKLRQQGAFVEQFD